MVVGVRVVLRSWIGGGDNVEVTATKPMCDGSEKCEFADVSVLQMSLFVIFPRRLRARDRF